MRQLAFNILKDYKKEFGGSLLVGKRKAKRPLAIKNPIHLVLRGDVSQTGSLLKHRQLVETSLSTWAKKFQIKIYSQAIVSNHLHLVIKVNNREAYNNFARVVSGVLAKAVKIKWLLRPFTRLLTWGRDYVRTQKYVYQNHLEAIGTIPYQPRRKFRKSTAPP